MLTFYRTLLHLRQSDPAFRQTPLCEATAPDEHTVIIRRPAPSGELLMVARLRGQGTVDISRWVTSSEHARWSVVLTS
jgi:hypothetical protein